MKRLSAFPSTAIILMLFSLLVMAGQKPAQDARQRFVDVTVTREGELIKDLTAKDFRLFEDGKELKIQSVELVPSRKRLAVIFHDPQFWSRKIMTETEDITEALVQLARLGYELMIFKLDWIKGLERLQPYTSREEHIRRASDQAMMSIGIDKSLEDLSGRSLAEEISSQAAAFLSFERRGELQSFLIINRRRFEKVAGGILAICNLMSAEAERGLVLLISSGIPDLSSSNQARILDGVPDPRNALDAIHSRDQENIGTIRIFDPFHVLGDKKYNLAEEVLRELIQFANSQNISIYSLDPGFFSRSVFSSSSELFRPEDSRERQIIDDENTKQKQNLRLISEETNAAFFRGSGKFQDMQLAMNRDAGFFYRLSFKPRRSRPDGKFHDLQVKVPEADGDVRFRKMYTDYTADDIQKISLVSAFYNPEFVTTLPFDAGFVPFLTKEGDYVPWINLALPTQELFRDRVMVSPRKTFHLHFWIKETRGGEKGFQGQINIALNMNQSLRDYINRVAYLWFFFRGNKLPFSPKDYQAVYALVDVETQEIGAWQTFFSIPDIKKEKQEAFINCVLGSVSEHQEKKDEVFAINKKNGSLEYGKIRFRPRVINKFSMWEEGFVFLQVYAPRSQKMVKPEFLVTPAAGDESQSTRIPGELVAGSYIQKSGVWNGIYQLNFFDVLVGENIFQAKIPDAGGNPIISQKIKFIKLRN